MKWDGEVIMAKDGQAISIDPNVGFFHVCCDCGLTHSVQFKKNWWGKWAFVVWRENREMGKTIKELEQDATQES